MLHWKTIIHVLGLLIAICGMAMLLALPFAFYYDYPQTDNPIAHSTPWVILGSAIGALLLGSIIWFLSKDANNKELKKRDGYLIVTLGWLVMAAISAIPYVAGGAIPSYTDAFFETMSGFTTTGASILADQIEILPKGLHFWRAMTQWIGGMGIIVLTIAILPLLGIGGMSLYAAEVPGPTPDKLTPRVKETAKRLWIIYAGLTLMETLLLMLGDMNFYDAICHAMTTMSTGGFSTRQGSMADFGAYSQYIVILFMFIAGINFSLTYYAIRGKLNRLWSNEEFRLYSFVSIAVILVATIIVYFRGGVGGEVAFRNASFQVISIITTTGFGTYDFTTWGSFLLIVFFILMFTGACAGSTSGGVKFVRTLVIFKNSYLELKRQIHPKAILPVRFSGKAISSNVVSKIVVFYLIFFLVFVFGCLLMSALANDFTFDTVMGSVAATLGNIGPGIGAMGPGNSQNFALVPDAGKWVLSFLMLLGRLELFTVLMLFTPFFWRDN